MRVRNEDDVSKGARHARARCRHVLERREKEDSVSEGTNTKTVQQVYENFEALGRAAAKRPDLQPLLSLYADDVEWHVPEMEDVPFAGPRKGIAGVRDFLTAVTEDLEVLQFEPREYIAQGDKVVALGRYSWRVKATGREFSSDFAHVCTVRDGKIVRFHEYMDTAAEIRAHKKRQARP
jgi:ketosteroid isomerase-like protein